MLRIGFYTSEDCFGGLEKNTLRFIEWLRTEHNQISLLTVDNSVMGEHARNSGTMVLSVKKPSSYLDIAKAYHLSRILKDQNIKLLIVIRPRDILMASIVRMIFYRKLKLIFFQQSILNLKKHPFLYKLLFRPFDAWISPSDSMAGTALKLTRYTPARMIVNPPCIDVANFTSDTLSSVSARKILGLPAEKLIIGVCGRYKESNSLDFFIRAIQFLDRHTYDIDLLIYGQPAHEQEEEYKNFLIHLAVECNVEKKVHFRINKEKLVTFFRGIDIFVTNRIPQPYDMIIPKALAAGRSVLAPYSAVNTELLENGNIGILYKHKDLADFSRKIIHLVTQPKLREHLVLKGQQAMLEKYDRLVGCQRIHTLIDRITGENDEESTAR